MKKGIFGIMVAFMAVSFWSCEKVVGTGPVVTEVRDINSFTAVALSVSGTLDLREGSDYHVELSAQENILDELQTFVSGGELVIKVRDGVRLRTDEPIHISITAPAIDGLRVNSSGALRALGSFGSDYFKTDISGSGSIEIDQLEASHLDANISGSGYIRVFDGSAQTAHYKISGSGHIDAREFEVNDVETTTSGSGTMKIFATDKLDATISGSGSVFYQGNPAVNTHISGSGKVVKL